MQNHCPTPLVVRQQSRSWIFTLQFFEVKLRWFLTPSVPQQLFLAMMNITVNPKLHSESSCKLFTRRRHTAAPAKLHHNHPSFLLATPLLSALGVKNDSQRDTGFAWIREPKPMYYRVSLNFKRVDRLSFTHRVDLRIVTSAH